jgi:hypothetical protein
MKRLQAQPPTEPRPEVSCAVQQQQEQLSPISPPVIKRSHQPIPVLTPPALERVDTLSLDKGEEKLPPASIYGHNLKKLSSYNKLRRNKKLSIQKEVFLQDVGTILAQFPVEEYQYDDELLITFLDICESYFVSSSAVERKEAKAEALVLMLPYFKDDVQLLKKSVSHVWHKVKKSSMLKRMWSRLTMTLKKSLC